jgi:hypothetical protein
MSLKQLVRKADQWPYLAEGAKDGQSRRSYQRMYDSWIALIGLIHLSGCRLRYDTEFLCQFFGGLRLPPGNLGCGAVAFRMIELAAVAGNLRAPQREWASVMPLRIDRPAGFGLGGT